MGSETPTRKCCTCGAEPISVSATAELRLRNPMIVEVTDLVARGEKDGYFGPADNPRLLVINKKSNGDNRGVFRELFRSDETGIANFHQGNFAESVSGTVRGMHNERDVIGRSELKALTVIRGSLFDFCMDVDPKSPTFGKVFVFYLNAKNPQVLFVGSQILHGYFAPEPVEAIYGVDMNYPDIDNKKSVFVRLDDPTLRRQIEPIIKPLLLNSQLIASEKDLGLVEKADNNGKFLASIFPGIEPKC